MVVTTDAALLLSTGTSKGSSLMTISSGSKSSRLSCNKAPHGVIANTDESVARRILLVPLHNVENQLRKLGLHIMQMGQKKP
jgi:hypothetical protein